MKYPQTITSHHLLSQSHGGHGLPANIRRLKENVHRAFHTVFDDRHPIQQLRDVLEINRTVLDPLTYYHLSDQLSLYERNPIEAYKPELFNADKFLTRINK